MTKSQKQHLLIIEDDFFLLNAMQIKLQEEGFVVSTATTAEQGIKLTDNHQPEAVILDILLPGKDGYHVLRHIKDNPNLHHIPIIISSNLDPRVGTDPRADDYIVKSELDLDELATRIKSHLAPVAK